jgi:hypothetical protein
MAENISNLIHLHHNSSNTQNIQQQHHQQQQQQQTTNDHMKLLFNMFQRGDISAKSLDNAFEYFEQSFRKSN